MAAQKAWTVGGIGSQPTLDDVLRVAQGQPVALDTAGAERVKKASPPPKSFQPLPAPAAPSAAPAGGELVPLTQEQTRAAIVVKLLQLMNGRSGARLQVAQFLASLLSTEEIFLALRRQEGGKEEEASDASLLKQLADALLGVGFARSRAPDAPAQPLSQALPALEVPQLSAAEALVLQGGGAFSAGVACIAVQASKKLLALASATAALSFEASGAQVRAAPPAHCSKSMLNTGIIRTVRWCC